MPKFFSRASSLAGLAEVGSDLGFNLKSEMKTLDLDAKFLRTPEAHIPFDQLCALLETCAANWSAPDLGLKVAPYQQLEVLGPVALVTKIERDLHSALTAMIHNLVIHTNAVVATIEENDDVAALILDIRRVPAGTRQYSLLAVGMVKNVMEQAGNGKIEFLEVSFQHDEGAAGRAARAFFGCSARFGAERNALYFDRSVLDRPMEQSDQAYHEIIAKYLRTTRQDLAGQTSDTVRNEIAHQMELGECSLESVAQSMKVEPRSLQRRLKQEGVSFRSLMDDWRRARALALITRTRLPLSEISLALGYADQSIFSRAFQRWYGEAPLSYRQMEVAGNGRS